jgi:demethylmenaquinone methyltransferase/2-methoxy-6-polyprenyl-1,4-benzoquinol methylase
MSEFIEYGVLGAGETASAQELEHGVLVRERYDRLAPYIGLIDHLLVLSSFRVRARAIACLPLRPGDTVVELGCGTGHNFAHLRQAVGPFGRVIGVEFSPKMLALARRYAERAGLGVDLIEQDLSRYTLPETDLVLLSLCYHTLESPAQTLARIWESLRPGACLAIIDGKPPDIAENYFRPFGARVLESVFMGNAELRPWDNLARLGRVEMKRFVFGAFYVCWAVKR